MSDVPTALNAALRDLVQAATSGDPTAAAPHATQAGWNSRADSARRLVKMVAMEGLGVRLTGPAFVTPDQARAGVRAEVTREGEVVDTIHVLFRTVDDAWKVEGVTQDRTVLQLFLADAFSPVTELWDLPSDPDGEAWGEERARALSAGEVDDDPRAARLREDGLTDVRVDQVVHLEPVNRVGVIFEIRGERGSRESMSVLQRIDGTLHPIAHGELPTVAGLVDGLEIGGDLVAEGDTVRARIEAVLSAALGQLLRAVGVDPAGLPDGSGKALTNFLAASAAHGDLPTAGWDPSRLQRAWGGDLAKKVERRAQHRVAALLAAEGIDIAAIDPDSDEGRAALEQHAPRIVRTLFGAVLLGAAPVDPGTDEIPEAIPAVRPWVQAAMALVVRQQQGQA